MSIGSLTLACLLLTANAEVPEVWHMSQTRFSIPIRIHPDRQADIRELLLYASRDEGRTWDLVARTTPDKEAFPFIAPADGPYWFSVAIVNRQGQQEPRDILEAPVGQRLVVDTARPLARIQAAERVGDEVVVRWQIQDAHPDLSTLKLEYRTPESIAGMWTPVGVRPGDTEARFRPGVTSALTLRLQVKDLAGNEGSEEREVPAQPGLSPAGASTVSAYPTGPASSPGSATTLSQPLSSPLSPTTPPSPTSPTGPTSPPPPPPAGQGTPPEPRTPWTGGAVMPAVAASTSPAPSPVGTYPDPQGSATVVSPPGQEQPPASAYSPGGTGSLVNGSLPRRIINQRETKLEFEVSDFGPSGLGGVDAYLTTDDGRTWEQALRDARPTLPPLGDLQGKSPVRGFITLALPREGVTYGVILIVKSRAGLGMAPPRPGESPQIIIEVDTTLPEAELYSPQPDPTRKDALLLSWKATDRKLATNPVSVEWAAHRDGPWHFIGGPELPNTGRFAWAVPADIPPHVFLKLTVRDAAGNTAVAQTSDPVLVDLARPKVRIIGLTGPAETPALR